jgi:uncharacterized membrane protein
VSRVSRNFWILVAAAVLAAGLLSMAARLPPSPLAGVLTAVSGLAAAASVALAGRILVVTGTGRASARARHGGRRRAS